jgi:ATP-binding cassette subfamily B multidrug efflux pump
MSEEQFISEDQVKRDITYRQLFQRLWPYCRRHLGFVFLVFFCVLGLALSARSLPFLIGYAIDHGIQARNYEVLKTTALIYLAVQILQTIFQFSYAYVFQLFGNRVLFYIREDLIRHIQSLPIQYFNKTPVGRIVTRLTNDVATLSELFTEGVITIIVESVLLFSILIAMTFISWKLTLITMFSAPVFIWASLKISHRIRELLREAKKILSTLNSFVAENLSGIKVIQLYNRVPRNRIHFFKVSQEYKDLTLASIRAYAFMHPVMNLFSAVTISIALYAGGYFHQKNGLAIGSVVAFLMLVQDFIPPLREILEKYQQFQNSLTSGERVFQVFDEIPEQQLGALQSPEKWRGQIEIKNLNFRYSDHLPLVLKDISLSIQSGQSVAIVGRTGSGKSTLISLLQRFYEPPAESILIDQVPLERIPFSELRHHVGVVQQDNFIFRGTIASNIGLQSESITFEQIERACRQVGYWDLLVQTGRNLQSHVEERGANISVGERQLIAFARILAFQPDILILDEATANIDSHSEKIIQQATAEVSKGRTSVIIAHRLSTIEKCDLILVLENGEIKERGTHEELMARRGVYHYMASAGVKSTEILSSAPGTAVP